MADKIKDLLEIVDLSQSLPLNQIIYDGLRTAIITGVIPMGERINEKQYAEILNVSRTPVREALRRIQDEGIVEYIPNYGIVVTTFSENDVYEIYQIRTSLDILAAINSMKLMTKADFLEMEDLLDRTDKAQNEGNVKEVIELSKDFNSLIYKFARMSRLETIQNRLRDYLIRFRDISLTASDRRCRALEEHRMIYRCLINGEVEQMKMIITEHLELSRDFILLEMKKDARNNKWFGL